MPTLYSENTTYSGSSPSIKYPRITGAMLKSMKEKSQNAVNQQLTRLSSIRNRVPTKTATTVQPKKTLNTEDMAPYVNSGVTLAPAFKAGTTVKQYEAETGAPYQFAKPTTGYQTQGDYLKPSEISPEAKFTSLSEMLGGGQYIVDPANPGKAILTPRPAADYKRKELELQGLDPTLYQIDHKIPLWAGGADTAANKEILTNSEHDLKTRIQAVPLTLLAHGLMDQQEAMATALRWKDRADVWDLNYPEPSRGDDNVGAGLIDIEQAKKIAEKWKETPRVTLKGFLSEIPAAGEKIYQAGAKLVNKILPGESAPEVGIKEFTKGFASGIPVYSSAMPKLSQFKEYEDETANVTGKISHTIGAIAGNVATFGFLYKAALKGMANMGVKWAAKELGKEAIETTAKSTLSRLAAKPVLTVAEEMEKKSAEEALKKLPGIVKTLEGAGIKEAKEALRVTSNALPKALTLGTISSAMGQLQPIPEDQTRAERAAYDFAYGAFFPTQAGYNLKGYAKVAVPALSISLMEGLRPTDSYSNAMAAALINAGTMVGMHGLGHAGTAYKVATGKAPKGILTARVTPEEIAEPKAFLSGSKIVTIAPELQGKKGIFKKEKTLPTETKDTTDLPTVYSEKTPETVLEKKMKERALDLSYQIKDPLATEGKMYLSSKAIVPEELGIKSMKDFNFPKTNDPVELNRQNSILYKLLDWKADYYGWDDNYLKLQKLKVWAASREQYKAGLGYTARNKAELEDWISYSERMRIPDPDNLATSKGMKNLASNLTEDFHIPPSENSTIVDPNSNLMNGKVMFTGINVAENEAKNRQFITDIRNNRYAVTPVKNGYLMTVYAEIDPNRRNIDKIAEGAAKWAYDKNKTIVINAVDKDGVVNPIAVVADKSRIEDPTGQRKWTFNQNALDEWNKKHKTNLKLNDLTPIQREEIGLADRTINFETLANEMLKKGTPVIKMTALINPETMNSQAKGAPKSFFMGYLNDASWDDSSINKIKELMTKEVGLTPAQAESVTAGIKEEIKEPSLAGAPIEETPIKIKTTTKEEEPWRDVFGKQPVARPVKPRKVERIVEETLPEPKIDMTARIGEEISPEGKVAETKTTLGMVEKEKPEPAFSRDNDNPEVDFANNSEIKTSNQILTETGNKSWSNYNTQGINKGAGVYIDKVLETMSPNDPRYEKIASIKKDFDKKVIIPKAKEILAKNNGNEEKSLAEFKAEYAKKFVDNGLSNPLESPKRDRFVTKLFRDAAYSYPKKVLTVSKGNFVIEERSPVNKSWLADKLEKYNAANGTKLDIIHYEAPQKTPGEKFETPNIKRINDELLKKGYISMGASGNDYGTIYAVKYDPSLGKTKNEFIYNLLTKVMGFPKDVTGSAINKRSKIFNDYSLPNPVQGETYTFHTVTPEKRTLKQLGYDETFFEDSIRNGLATKKSVKEILDKDIFDGKIYITEKMMNRILKSGGYVGERTRLKPTMVSGEGNDMILQKGDLSVLDETNTKLFEDIIRKQPGMEKFKMSDNDVITFPENIKFGAKGKDLPYTSFKAPSESFRFKYSYEPTEKSAFSLSSWAKFGKDDELNKAVIDLYKPHIDKYKAFISELNASASSQEAKNILSKYKEYGKEEFGENLYGTVQKMVNNGAWHKSIGNTIDKMISKVFQEKLISGSFIKGNHLVLTPDMGAKNGAFLNSGEVMMSRKSWNDLGNPKYVLTKRYPVTRSTAMSKAKVLVAEDYGIKNLGKEQIIPSHFDTFVRKEGDFDADSFHVFAIGGENGIPEKVANRIESIRAKEGDMVMDPLEKYEATVLTDKNAYDVLQDLSTKAIQGGDAVGKVASMVRVLPYLVDSGFQVGNMKPVWNSKTSKYLSQLSQFSTDAVKSPSLYNELEKSGYKDMSDLLISKVFTNVETKADITKIKKAITASGFQDPFNLANKQTSIKSNRDLVNNIRKYNKSTFNKKNGPVQKIMEMLNDMEPYKYDFKQDLSNDIRAGERAVREKFNSEYRGSKNVNDFVKYVDSRIAEFGRLPKEQRNATSRDFKQSLIDYYREQEVNYTPEEKRSIHMWLASSPRANIANSIRRPNGMAYDTSKWANKLDEIFNDSSDIARTYYEALEGYNGGDTADLMVKKIPEIMK